MFNQTFLLLFVWALSFNALAYQIDWKEIDVDPKGHLPIWLVNLINRYWAANTLNSLRNYLNENDSNMMTKAGLTE